MGNSTKNTTRFFSGRGVLAFWRASLCLGLVATLVLGSTSVAVAAKADIIDAAPNSVLQQDVNRVRDIGTIAVLAVTTKGNTATRARAGVAVRGTNQPVDWGSHFRIGSNTKTFIATVILQLEAEGKLSLDDTVERWLPGVVQGNGNQ